jgi:hypothetical protein
MYPHLQRAADHARLRVELRPGVAEQLPAADNSVDTVVSTLVLCSVDDPAASFVRYSACSSPAEHLFS